MRRLPLAIALLFAAIWVLTACNSDGGNNSNWDKYADWRKENTEWFNRLRDSLDADGNLYYSVVYPSWNPAAEVLMHYFNDRALTEGNLSPLLNSTVDFIYRGTMLGGTAFDSSYLNTAYGRGIARYRPNQMITGVTIALMDMRVGDSAQVVLPYELGYGSGSSGSILPYSTLVFNLGMKDIPYYEVAAP